MIWYRHWLEMRAGLGFMAVFWLFAGLTVTGPFHSLEWDLWRAFPWHPFGQSLAETPLAQAIGDDVFVWSWFAGRILPFTFIATLALAGNGLHGFLVANGPHGLWFPSEASAAYTLTLPISRTRLVWTRLVAALGATMLAGALVSAVYAAALVAVGHRVPLGPVAHSLALGVVCVATALAVATALLSSVRYLGAFLSFAALFALMLVPVSYTAAAPARGEVPWGPLAAGLAISVLAVAFAIHRTSAREY